MIRLGFVLNISENWLGGLNYIRNLLKAVCDIPEMRIQPVVFIGNNTNKDLLRGFPEVEIVKTGILDRMSFPWLIRQIVKRTLSRDLVLERLLLHYRISIISHSDPLGKKSKIPTIGWIPDFQHIHLPQFCTDGEIEKRNHVYQFISQYSEGIILSSHDALKDLKQFAPQFSYKARVLQFVTESPGEGTALHELEQKYRFSGPFFYMPNQFWVHKNHKIVLQALTSLKKSSRDVLVLASGNPVDHRQPNYFKEIQSLIEKNELQDSFRALGIIPYADLVGLMNHCVALINPSLFEGWSTTVEESKSAGKKMILSDIPVHREQDPERGSYFNPTDPEELTEQMWYTWCSYNREEDRIFAGKLMSQTEERRRKFACTYEEIVTEFIN